MNMSGVGDDWGWLSIPAVAAGGAVVKALAWFARSQREAGRAESYKEHAIATIEAKSQEIAELRGEVADLKAALTHAQARRKS